MPKKDEYVELIAAYQAAQNFQFAILIKLLVENGSLNDGEYQGELERYLRIADRSNMSDPKVTGLLADFLEYLADQGKPQLS